MSLLGDRPTSSPPRRGRRWFTNLAASRGLLEGHATQSRDRTLEPHGSREQLARTARQLVHRASELERHFQEDADDLMSCVVGRATGMQELVEDLLAHSGATHTTARN